MKARTLQEILNQIRQSWVENPTLQKVYDLKATVPFEQQFSNVSLESILTNTFAYATWLYEQIVFMKSSEIEGFINEYHEFSIAWYTAKAKAFQLGDTLVFNENTYKFEYQNIDESKQIIKQVAIRERQVEGVTQLQIYVTKEGRVPLGADESAAFEAYIKDVGAAGTHFEIISKEPDKLKIEATVYCNPQIISAEEGKSFATGEKVVEIAIRKYLESIVYSGKFNRNKLIDSIQIVDGVNDIVLGDVYLNDIMRNNREFESQSGFFTATSELPIKYEPSYEN